MREDIIHYAIRQFLKRKNWSLVAGQYPDGSDDELPPLNVMDPSLARDNSPDHRRHSMNKLVPDLVACKGNVMQIIEMKPAYSHSDAVKLQELTTYRRNDLLAALNELKDVRRVYFSSAIDSFNFVPCLGFSGNTSKKLNKEFCYYIVSDIENVTFIGNKMIPDLS